MMTLVVGASGATGRLLVEQLLDRGRCVKVIVRVPSDLPEKLLSHENLYVVHANVLELSHEQLAEHVKGCDSLASCLGHNMSLKGIYGDPRGLVAEAIRRLCRAMKVNNPKEAVKVVLMNTTGYVNCDLNEEVSFAQKCIISLLRVLLPPHVDNEKAADYLRTEIGQEDAVIRWAVVRPDTLVDSKELTEYTAHPSPTRSAIFNAGTTSRINVGHFMAELITDNDLWKKWQGAMPVIYNNESFDVSE